MEEKKKVRVAMDVKREARVSEDRDGCAARAWLGSTAEGLIRFAHEWAEARGFQPSRSGFADAIHESFEFARA